MRTDLALLVTDGLSVDVDRHQERTPIQAAVEILAQYDPIALAALVRETQQRAGRDPLTGVWARAAGLDQLRRAVDRAHRTQEPLVVVFADLDGLKRINDTSGHAAGDQAIAAAGAALLGALRSYDVTLRYGGDEFVCALPHAGRAQAESRMAHVGAILHGACPGARLSSGFAMLGPGQSAEDVVQAADQDMYARRQLVRTTQRATARARKDKLTG